MAPDLTHRMVEIIRIIFSGRADIVLAARDDDGHKQAIIDILEEIYNEGYAEGERNLRDHRPVNYHEMMYKCEYCGHIQSAHLIYSNGNQCDRCGRTQFVRELKSSPVQ